MAKKLSVLVLALIPVAIWLYKVGNFVEVEQHNDRAEFNNSVIYVLNQIAEKTDEPRSYLQGFTKLEQMNESQQRSMWFLLEDMEFDFGQEIEDARAELGALASDGSDEKLRFVAEAEKLLDSHAVAADVYNELADLIRARTESGAQLAESMSLRFDELDRLRGDAVDIFERAQATYMNGD